MSLLPSSSCSSWVFFPWAEQTHTVLNLKLIKTLCSASQNYLLFFLHPDQGFSCSLKTIRVAGKEQ